MTRAILIQLSENGGHTWKDTCHSVDDEATAQICVDYYNRTDRAKRKYQFVPNKNAVKR